MIHNDALASASLSATGSIWGAAAASVTALTAIFAAFFAWRQVIMARRLRQDQAQPYVAVYIESEVSNPHFVDLVIKNYGRTAARNIDVVIDPPPQRSPDDHGENADEVLYPRTLHTLVPGQEWRTVWDFSPSRREMKLPDRYIASVEYDGVPGTRRQEYKYDLDWGLLIGRRWVSTYTVHDGAKALREIEKQVRRWSESLGGRGLRVFVRDGDEMDKRRRTERTEALREHEEITRMLGLKNDEQGEN